MTVVVPYEGQGEVLKLGSASGMLLEASVRRQEGVVE